MLLLFSLIQNNKTKFYLCVRILKSNKMISKKTIDEIFAVARVEEVIGDFMSLKKSGSNYKGISPFSNEKTPSFMISPSKQIWKDFSSGKGGTVVSFLMEQEQYSYPEALRWLARRYNIEIEEDQNQTPEEVIQAKEKETLYVITQKAQDFFKNQLHKTEEGKYVGISYFKEREIHSEYIVEFDLGYSPESWDALSRYLMNQGYSFEQLKEAGLSVGSESRPVDRFRNRVIFPIHSFSGRVLGFGGRALKLNSKTAKYLNSPETLIYHKSDVLYGIFQAKKEIIKKDQCILVEGYTDVISLHQKGVKNVVASSGTALTPEQIRLIKRLTGRVILMYDGDEAGVKATQRSIDLILEQDLDVSIVALPPEHDPDSFAKTYSREEIEKYIVENSVNFLSYKLNLYKAESLSPSEQSKLIEEVVKSISLIDNELKQELLIRQMSSLTSLGEEILFRTLNKYRGLEDKKKYKASAELYSKQNLKLKTEAVNPFYVIEEEIIRTLLSYGNEIITFQVESDEGKEEFVTSVQKEIIDQLKDDGINFTNQYYNKILEGIKCSEGDGFLKDLLSSEDTEIHSLVSKIAIEPYRLSNWEKKNMIIPTKKDKVKEHVENLILNYKRIVLQQRINGFLAKIEQGQSLEEEMETMNEIMFLNKLLKNLNEKQGRVI